MKTFIYGASDDLIEIDGQIREEFGAYNEEEGFYLALSNGTLLKGIYGDEGEWKFNVIRGGDKVTIIPAVGDDDEHEEYPQYTSYSDIVIIEENVSWVLMGTNLAK